MRLRSSLRRLTIGAFLASVLLATGAAVAATKTLDLDAQSSNGSESQCDLNVLETFPVKIENKVTNKAVGDSFSFVWRSAGPGGFSSSITPGSTGGVGAKWVWTTNQTVYSYTGGSCETDICFAQTGGTSSIPRFCSAACLLDGTSLTVARGATAGSVSLTWSGGQPSFTIFGSASKSSVFDPANVLATTSALSYNDVPPAGGVFFYNIRGVDCATRKACGSDASCASPGDGTCVSRGPFNVPGRSLFTNDVTVSSASLTSSLITFFSPPKEVFTVSSVSQPGGSYETLTNVSGGPVTATTESYPPGCCVANPAIPHQLRCGAECVDYLNDPDNCGACGNVCGDGTCCTNGSCESLCAPGQTWCDGQCVDFINDNANCGACGNGCGDGTCCSEAVCASICGAGQSYCGGGQCADLQDDNNNCGTCGNACGEGSCCTAGVCASVCAAGRTFCDGLCYDMQNDPGHCGACGNVCPEDSICVAGGCVACTGQGGTKDSCDNRCVNLNTDPYNCGDCGVSCNVSCPSGFKGVCSNGQSCRCAAGTPAPQPPPNIPPPMAPVCPNPDLTFGPVAGVCPNPHPSFPVPGLCPPPGPPGPAVSETPTCEALGASATIAPGGSSTICNPGGVLFKEVPTAVTACGDTLPGPDGQCGGGVSHVSTGTFMRLVPDTSKTVGMAYLTPFAVHVIADTSNDGMIQPGETASVLIEVLNAGTANITGAQASLLGPAVDLSQDGVSNPVGINVVAGSASYGTILGTQPSANCASLALHPASNAAAYQVSVPPEHPGDTAHPFTLHFTGTVDGGAFTMDVPISLGIADRCDFSAATRDYDGLDGLSSPMARLVPRGDPIPMPGNPFAAGKTRPLKLRSSCGGVNQTGNDTDPPEIIGLSEATRGPLDIHALSLNSDSTNPNDPFFRYNTSNGGQWSYNMRTSLIGKGTFTLTIRIAGRKEYVTGFVLQ